MLVPLRDVQGDSVVTHAFVRVIETYSAKLPRNAGPIPSLPFAELSLGEILVCPIRAHIQDLQHFEAFRDFAESVTYAGTTPGRLPTPPPPRS